MAAKVTLTFEGFREMQDLLHALSPLLDKATKDILDESAAVALQRNKQRFLEEKDPDGKPWIPSIRGLIRRSGGYTYRDGKGYTGTGTLFETGRLFHSIQLFRTAEKERQISTDVEYAAKLTLRWPFLGVNKDDLALMQAITVSRLSKLKFT